MFNVYWWIMYIAIIRIQRSWLIFGFKKTWCKKSAKPKVYYFVNLFWKAKITLKVAFWEKIQRIALGLRNQWKIQNLASLFYFFENFVSDASANVFAGSNIRFSMYFLHKHVRSFEETIHGVFLFFYSKLAGWKDFMRYQTFSRESTHCKKFTLCTSNSRNKCTVLMVCKTHASKVYNLLTEVQRVITINVPLFKKLRDIIFFWWENHFMSHFEGHFEGAKTFLTP